MFANTVDFYAQKMYVYFNFATIMNFFMVINICKCSKFTLVLCLWFIENV